MVFRIDLKIFIFLIMLYCTRQIEIYSIIMMFAFLHELGHLLAGILLRMKVKGISILVTGFSIEFNLTELDYNKKILKSNILEVKKIIVALAGPLVNILVIAVTLIFKNERLSNVIYANILIAIFNLLPIYPLDGGRILKSLLCLTINRKKAILYTNIISNIMLFLITFLSSIYIYYCKNIAILAVLIYLWYLVFKQNRICKVKLRLYEALDNL